MHTGGAGGRILFIEPYCGISGDMLLGALLDLGADPEHLHRQLDRLPLRGYTLEIRKCLKAGITSTKFDVHLASEHAHTSGGHHHHHHRTFAQIRTMIAESGLSAWVRERAVDAFARLAAAEGKVHDQAPEQVHFHEVGAVDSIIDIVGTMVALEGFLPLSIRCAPVNVGSGTLQCRHGVYPVPGPAALKLLEHIPIYSDTTGGELTTPTGAALLVTLVGGFGPRPPMRVIGAGYGAGTRDIPGIANVLRVSLAEGAAGDRPEEAEEVEVIDANIDDMNPQLYDHFVEKALALGALDVYLTPVQMKKNRPGTLLSVICAPERKEDLARLFFEETTTLGIRYRSARRRTLQRRTETVSTDYGDVRVKSGVLDGRTVNCMPEFEDCRRLALERNVPLKLVMTAAIRACRNR